MRHAGTDSLRKRHREKSQWKLTIARAAYERGDYEEAKTQIDSIKILYPKAFEARKAGQELMLDVELKAQQEILAFLDSALQAKQAAFDAIKGKYTLRKMPNISKWVTTYGLHKPSRRISIVPSFASKWASRELWAWLPFIAEPAISIM